MRRILMIVTGVCFFILLGTVGALETNTITMSHAITRFAIFAPIMIAAFVALNRKGA